MRKQKAFYLLAVTMLLFLVVTSCGLPNDQNGQGKVHPVSEVELILHQVSERDRKVGMGVGYDLQVKNHNTFPIEFAGFLNTGRQGQSYFAFSPPNAAYLIAPDGQDLFAVYSQDNPVNKQSAVYAGNTRTVIEEFDPLHVEANAERWQSFSLFQYAELWQTGTYTFWVELEDNLGQLHQSNKVNFTIEDVPPSAPIASLELDLRFEKDSYTIGELLDVDVGFEYSFKNRSETTVIFLRRLYYNMPILNPIYQLVVKDEDGRVIPIMGGDAPRYIVDFDESSFIRLMPGEEQFQKDYLPHFPGMRKPGEYRVQLTYIVYENDILSGDSMNWETGMFTGVLHSNEVVITSTE